MGSKLSFKGFRDLGRTSRPRDFQPVHVALHDTNGAD